MGQYLQGQRSIIALDAVRRVKRGGYGSGAGDADPPPPSPPPSPWRRGATEGLGAQGQVTSLLTLPCAKTGAWLPPLFQ